jgi:hypothetical protein
MRTRTCCCLLIPLVLVGSCLTALLVYYAASGGGYWENRSPFDRLSGPWRFAQYVCFPIPGEVNGLRGGYSGFTGGFIGTRFSLEGQFPAEDCLGEGWETRPVDELEGILWIELSPDAVTRAFVFGSAGEENLRFLLVDEDNGRGYLYVPQP